MNNKKVMPEDIDYGLVEQIYKGIENDVPTSSLYREDIQTIRATLAYLANNPIDLTPEAQGSITKEWNTTNHDWTNYVKFIADRTQRIAFLKQEPILPEDVRKLLIPIGGQPADNNFTASWHNEKIIAAWKIGAGIK